MQITKAVIPVAGKGTRFLPATKEVPKEMIPLLGRPMLHYIVKEAVSAGFKDIVLVNSPGKEITENYFRPNSTLETFLRDKNKQKELQMIEQLLSMAKISVAIQHEQLGLGHALLCAKVAVEGEAFACLLGDDVITGARPAIGQLYECAQKNGASVVGVMEVKALETSKYGIIKGEALAGDSATLKIEQMVEKPKPEEAPSRLATPGRYIFTADIFDYLEKIPRDKSGEYQLTDAINLMAQEREVYAHIFRGERFDAGTIEAHFKASIELALRDPDYASMAKDFICEKYKSITASAK